MEKKENKGNKELRMGVFLPAILFIGGAAILGLVNNKALTDTSKKFFFWSLDTFGWLYQIVVMTCFILITILLISKFGNVRIGGKNAKAKYSFATWFAMTLTGGVATGIVTWGVNEPLIYYGNVWGELDGLGIAPLSAHAERFALGRSFYNWSILPYAIYAMCGLIVAYVYFNKKEKLNVTSTLKPLFGERITKGVLANVIDLFAMLALTLGLTSGLTMCITLITAGLKSSYGIAQSLPLFIIIGVIVALGFTFSSYIGLDKGLKNIANVNAYFYYGLLILLFVTGPIVYIMKVSTAGMAEWLQNFWIWGLDPGTIGGDPLVKSWTLFDWAIWIAYAPVTGIFLGMISYGRTIREYLIVNWILPSVFGIVWFCVWGGNALHMQATGAADLVGAIQQNGAVFALFEFMKHLPFNLGVIIIPINLIVILISFVTAADAASTNIASMCVKNVPIGTEPPALLKVLWGVVIAIVAIIMAAFGGSEQGVEGVKQLATAGGFVVLFIFVLQLISFVKMFFFDKLEE